VSHAAVKSFDRRGVSCKNARTVQFSGGVEKCPVTQKTALPLANCCYQWTSAAMQTRSVAVRLLTQELFLVLAAAYGKTPAFLPRRDNPVD